MDAEQEKNKRNKPIYNTAANKYYIIPNTLGGPGAPQIALLKTNEKI